MDRAPAGRTVLSARVAVAAIALVAVAGAFMIGWGVGTDSPAEGAVVENVTGETTVTVIYSTPANGTSQFVVDGVEPGAVGSHQGWAYLPRSALPSPLERVAGDHTAGVVTVGQWALVGDLDASSTRIGSADLTVVAPAGMDVDPGRKAGFLGEFVSPYSLHPDEHDRITLLIAPDALPSDGRMYGDTGYITQHAFWDGDVSSVWIHEFVHARQDFTLPPDMQWFTEGSATYFSYRMLEEQFEEVTEADVRARLAAQGNYRRAPLANQSAWDSSHADYHRGAKLLYIVDAEIRTASGGNHTVVDVFRTMNRRDGPVSVDEFVRIVERYSGEDEDWLRPAIRGTEDLDPHVERVSAVFEE